MLYNMSFSCTSQIWPCINGLEPRHITHLEDKDNFSGLKIVLLGFCFYLILEFSHQYEAHSTPHQSTHTNTSSSWLRCYCEPGVVSQTITTRQESSKVSFLLRPA